MTKITQSPNDATKRLNEFYFIRQTKNESHFVPTNARGNDKRNEMCVLAAIEIDRRPNHSTYFSGGNKNLKINCDRPSSSNSVKLPWNRDAFGVTILCWDRLFQFLQCSALFQLFHQTLDRFLRPFSLDRRFFVALFPCEQSLHYRRRERQHRNESIFPFLSLSPIDSIIIIYFFVGRSWCGSILSILFLRNLFLLRVTRRPLEMRTHRKYISLTTELSVSLWVCIFLFVFLSLVRSIAAVLDHRTNEIRLSD